MPSSRGLSKKVIEGMFRERSFEEFSGRLKKKLPAEVPLPGYLPRETVLTREAQAKRLEILGVSGKEFIYLSGRKRIEDPEIFAGNIENYVGLAQIPVGVIGPLRINGLYANGDFYVPMATVEGALVASYNRGAKVISFSGGAQVMCLLERISRAPGFIFTDLVQAGNFIVWIVSQFEKFQSIAKTTTTHGNLEDLKVTIDGNWVFINFDYYTGDAAGQNMVTIATEAICEYIMGQSPVKPKKYFIESNLSGDKKASAISYLSVRGKKVTAEVVVPREIFKKFLHTTPEIMMEYWKMSFVGGVQSGSIGVQGHFANGLTALFIACGQDAACVAEAATGITRVDVTEDKDLYISVTLPNLIVGTVGGGTHLPTQRECLELLGCVGDGTSRKFAEICAVTILAGELSIMGAIASGQFAKAHALYRKKPK